MSRVLFLTQVLPYPLDAGPKVRAYHVLRWLAERSEVHLASFVRPDDPPSAIDHLRELCASVHTVAMPRSRLLDAAHLVGALATGRSFIIARDEVRAMRSALRSLTHRLAFDAVHADQLWMARYAHALPVPFKVLDDHNAVFRVFERLAVHEPTRFKRWLWRREAGRIAAYESSQAAAFDQTLFVSAEDRRAVIDVASREQASRIAAHSRVIPICVDPTAIELIDVVPHPRRLTMLGTMFWPPNSEGAVWFAEAVLPRVLQAVPDAVFTVIGKQPPASVRSLADRFGAAVSVEGYVDAVDVEPYLARTAAFVVPLLSGGGMRVKILDAWAWGVPVVSTRLGAEGVDVRPDEDVLLADDPDAFADACIRLLTDSGLRSRLAHAGRDAVESRYSAARVYSALEAVYGPVAKPVAGAGK